MAHPKRAPALADDAATTGVRPIAEGHPGGIGGAEGAPPTLADARTCETWEVPADADSEPPVPEGGMVGGRYIVEHKLAEGGMGVVCFGRHAQLGQPVAIKFLKAELTGKPAIVERFLNEARALAALRSQHVVRVMDVGQLDSGRPYLVMEHLEGVDLEALVNRDGALPVPLAIDYVLQACEPLAEAHALGIVHRDVKPENLFLWSGGPGENLVKVLDFGLAKLLGSSRGLHATGPTDSMGSPCYMSPEQVVTPHEVDARTDIWSIGVVLYRLLTDTLPFDGGNLLEVLSHVLSAEPRPLREVRPSLDHKLEAIVMRCLEKKPEARYASVTELMVALREYLAERETEPTIALAPVSEASPTIRSTPKRAQADRGRRLSRPVAAGLCLFALAGLGFYQADHTGRIRLRNATDGWLTPAALQSPANAEPPSPVQRTLSSTFSPFLRGVSGAQPARGAQGEPTLRAEPEPELDSPAAAYGAVAPPAALGPKSVEVTPSAPLSESERQRKLEAYRDFLQSQGMTPLNETPPPAEEQAPPAPVPAPADNDDPASGAN